MGARLTAAAFAFVTTITARAAAQTAARTTALSVELVGERGAIDAAKLDTLVGLELGANAIRVSAITIVLRAGRADIDVRLGVERREGSVVIETVEPERALALFVAELARGSAGPPTVGAAEPVAIAQRDEAEPAPPASPRPTAPRWRLSVVGSMGARVMTAHGALLATPALEIGARQDGVLRLGVTVRYGYASADDPLGSVHAHFGAAGVAATYVLASGALFALATGPRFETGLIAGRGDGSKGTSTSAFTLGGSWELEGHVLVGGLSLVGALEGGVLFRGVELHANERDVLHLSGPFVGLSVGAML